MVQLFIVGNIHTRANVLLPLAHLHVDAELATLLPRLLGHAQRGEDQHVAAGMLVHVVRPCELHRRLSHAAVAEQRSASLSDGPTEQVSLEVEEHRIGCHRLVPT